jgi:acetoin utilization protein AcuB
MFVRERMSSPAVTITPETTFQDALKLMRDRKFRRLPVVDEDGRLVGIVSERDLLHASPSPATSLSVFEINYLLWKLKIADMMTHNVISIASDAPIENAAGLMVSNKVGGLPVVDRDNKVIGLITETDIFRAFVELLGGGEKGLRLTLSVPSGSGTLAKLATAITELGGVILSVGSLDRETDGKREVIVKVRGVKRDEVIAAMERLGDHVLDAREV